MSIAKKSSNGATSNNDPPMSRSRTPPSLCHEAVCEGALLTAESVRFELILKRTSHFRYWPKSACRGCTPTDFPRHVPDGHYLSSTDFICPNQAALGREQRTSWPKFRTYFRFGCAPFRTLFLRSELNSSQPSLELALRALLELLPQGRQTADNCLFSVLDDQARPVWARGGLT